MAILKTSWGVKKASSVKKAEKEAPKKIVSSYKVVESKKKPEKVLEITEETTAEEIIATLFEKQHGDEKVNIEE